MENIAPLTKADLDFVQYIKKTKTLIDKIRRDNSGKNDDERSLSEDLNVAFYDFYSNIKTKRVIPLEQKKKEDSELLHTFF